MKNVLLISVCVVLGACGELKEKSCSASKVPEGVLIQCPDGTSGIVQDGESPNPASIVEVIDPCGPEHPQGLDEVLLRLQDGVLLGALTDRTGRVYLTVVSPGSWITTDGTSCRFRVTEDLQIEEL